jgi:hypothetical protein
MVEFLKSHFLIDVISDQPFENLRRLMKKNSWILCPWSSKQTNLPQSLDLLEDLSKIYQSQSGCQKKLLLLKINNLINSQIPCEKKFHKSRKTKKKGSNYTKPPQKSTSCY